MTEDQPGFSLPNLFDPKQAAEASEEIVDRQQKLFQQWMAMAGTGTTGDSLADLDALCTTTAAFKTRVQSGGRISIPDVEREALDIEEGDIVQTIIVPISRNRNDD